MLSANSTSNTAVVVTFSEPVAGGIDSAENPKNYSIVNTTAATGGSSVTPQAIVLVESAVLSANKRTVTLTTLSQSEIDYALKVTDVKDLVGNQLAPPDREHPFQVTFFGTGPSGVSVDSDGDGLSDAKEQRGWTVTVKLLNGQTATRQVTSDPKLSDTDADGILDNDEANYLTDPRNPDTDDDQLSDWQELNEIYSDPTAQDTDSDGLADGLEVDFFKTSALLADTDGDQFLDGDEVVTDNRNPRLADLPRVEIEIGTVDLRLDVRFEEQTSRGTRTLDSKSVTTTLTQSKEDALTTESSSTNEWFAKAGGEVCFSGGCETEGGTLPLIPANGAKATFEAGGSGSKTFSTTTSSTQATQREYATSLTTDKEVSAESVVTRSVEGATMAVAVNLRNTSNIAFTISDIEITARIQDPRDASAFVPVATLFAPSSSPISIGPITSARGPFRFVANEAFPQLVESLMQNPRGLLFSVANFEIEDEFGRKFAFVEQDINDRTAFLEIDYKGNEPLEKLQIATNATFGPSGKPTGITMKQAMEDVLGLEHKIAVPSTPYTCVDATPASELETSYSTCEMTVAGKKVQTLWRVKTVSKELTDPNRDWWVLTPQGLISPVPKADPPFPGADFNSTVLFADQDFAFKFVQDLDADFLEAGQEALYRSIDSADDTAADPDKPDSRDTDNDGIDDGVEVYGFLNATGKKRVGWTIRYDDGRDAIKTFANPGRADTDLDGLNDCQELLANPKCSAIQVYLDSKGVPTLAAVDNTGKNNSTLTTVTLSKPTDPSNPDTDGDGLTDAQEAIGFRFTSLFGSPKTFTIVPKGVANCESASGAIKGDDTTFCDLGTPFATNPLSTQTDGDGLADFLEAQLGTNPVISDGDSVRDDDGDGLVNLQETTGWDVTWVDGAGVHTARDKSDPKKPDTDGDGLTDWEEFKGCRDRNHDLVCDSEDRFGSTRPIFADTDADGLSDRQEIDGVAFPSDTSAPYRFTDPRNIDTDGDDRFDGDEVTTPLVVTVAGQNPYRVFSDPLIADADIDGLNDGKEKTLGTDPTKFDTDDEGDGIGDGDEASICVNATCKSPLVKDQKVAVTFFFNVSLDGDLDAAGGSGDFTNTLTVARAGGATFTFNTQQFIDNNTIKEVWTASFIKPYSEAINIGIAVFEDDSGTSDNGKRCRIDDTRGFTGKLSSTDSYSTNLVNDFQGDPIAECKYKVDVVFGVN